MQLIVHILQALSSFVYPASPAMLFRVEDFSAMITIVAGVCVAFIAIIADRLISAWVNRRKKESGLVS